MTAEDLYHYLVSSIQEAQLSAVEDFGAVELVGCTSKHVATLLEQAVPFLNCQGEDLPKSVFRFMGVYFSVIAGSDINGQGLWWRLKAVIDDYEGEEENDFFGTDDPDDDEFEI